MRIAASQLVASATNAALISALRRKDIFTDTEIEEIYTEALTLLQIDQSDVPEFKHVSDMAIEMLKVQLGVPDNDN